MWLTYKDKSAGLKRDRVKTRSTQLCLNVIYYMLHQKCQLIIFDKTLSESVCRCPCVSVFSLTSRELTNKYVDKRRNNGKTINLKVKYDIFERKENNEEKKTKMITINTIDRKACYKFVDRSKCIENCELNN